MSQWELRLQISAFEDNPQLNVNILHWRNYKDCQKDCQTWAHLHLHVTCSSISSAGVNFPDWVRYWLLVWIIIVRFVCLNVKQVHVWRTKYIFATGFYCWVSWPESFLNIRKSTARSPLLFMVICHKSYFDVSGSNAKEEGKQISVVSEGTGEREVIPRVNIETHKILLIPFVGVYCLWSKMSLQVLLSCCWFWTSGSKLLLMVKNNLHEQPLCILDSVTSIFFTPVSELRRNKKGNHCPMFILIWEVYHHCYATVWYIWKWNDPPVNTLLCHCDKPSWNYQEDLQ